MKIHRFIRVVALVVMVVVVGVRGGDNRTEGIAIGATIDACSSEELQNIILTLDGVKLNLCTSFLPKETFIASQPDDIEQVASSMKWDGSFEELSIIAIPFGIKPSTESLPVAQKGGSETYRNALKKYRTQQGATPVPSPEIMLFGEQVSGLTSILTLPIYANALRRVAISEWVVEVGDRIWIVRVSQEILETASISDNESISFISNITLDLNSPDPDIASTSISARTNRAIEASVSSTNNEQVTATDLPFPSWWNGECNVNNHPGAYNPTGVSYRGVKACTGGDNMTLVRFFSGAWGEYEWQCVEFVMRFLYLAYGIKPYQANGSQVVGNYSGSTLVKINNGTIGKAPEPNDILSYGPTSTFGHTSVVVSSDVDANGNGSVRIIQQNVANFFTLQVSNWNVLNSLGITGWLHDPTSDDTTPPTGNITSPSDGSATNNPAFTVTADASDNDGGSGVDRVEFYIGYDGSFHLTCTDTDAPYDCSWDASGTSDQDISFTIHVIDRAGNRIMDPGGFRTVKLDRVLPDGNITSPADGSTTTNPAFTITADASDNDGGSGVKQVNFYASYDGDWHELCTLTEAPYTCSWDASDVNDQEVVFTIHVIDRAGNTTMDPGGHRHVTLDHHAPTFPETVTSEGSEDDTWQNGVAQPTFTWSEAQDAVAGVEGYLIYWGTDPDGTSDVLQTDTTFDALEPVADGDGAATYYLRMATRDTFGNTSAWQTIYTFRYDNSKPAGTAELNHGWGIAHSVAMPIALFPEDNGSGATNVRLSNDGTTWSDWFPMQDVVWWQVDRSHGDTAPVAVQYRDAAGNESDAITQSLALDFYPPLPSSSHYRIQTDVVGTGGGSSTSANYVVNATAGQVLASGDYASSSHYRASLGYWSQMNAAVSGDTKVYIPLVLLR